MKWNTYIHMDEYNGLNQSEEWARINKENARKSQHDFYHIDEEFGYWYMKTSQYVSDVFHYYTKEDWLSRHRIVFRKIVKYSIWYKQMVFAPAAMSGIKLKGYVIYTAAAPNKYWMYPCEYARLRLIEEQKEKLDEEKSNINNKCKYCLLDWEGSKCKCPCRDQYEDGDGKGLFSKYLQLDTSDWVEGMAVARRIEKLPLRKEND